MTGAEQFGMQASELSGAVLPPPGGRNRVFLLPGQLHASKFPAQVVTILGSCVSICLWDSRLQAGGVNHFLLPTSHDGERGSSRFGDVATSSLLEMLEVLGSRPRNLVAKVFGGASMLRSGEQSADSLGQKNVQTALRLMKNSRIEVVAQDTGGNKGRKIVFHSDSGYAWVRYV